VLQFVFFHQQPSFADRSRKPVASQLAFHADFATIRKPGCTPLLAVRIGFTYQPIHATDDYTTGWGVCQAFRADSPPEPCHDDSSPVSAERALRRLACFPQNGFWVRSCGKCVKSSRDHLIGR
jgi:hypothetical protein